ncbi:C40 family peptidase [Bacillus badius]|uniref:C40 family peptidase n=1 Tax=Bacillus badius TaxID=1455 RepID=UPI002E23E37C|nr:C40 family peptidase [Bacillus badius]
MKKLLMSTVSIALAGTMLVTPDFQPLSKNEAHVAEAAGQSTPQQLIAYAKNYLGKPYVFGATGPNSFDCSGFIYYVFKNNGYDISRLTVEGYWNLNTLKKISSPVAGDLIFFKNTYRTGPSHMGIMVNSTQFIHAGSSGGVQISDVSNSYWKEHFLGYGRFAADSNIGDPSNNPYNGTMGTLKITYPEGYGVNAYNSPGGTYKQKVFAGSYKVYSANNGWYDIGNSTWVQSSEHAQFKQYLAYINYPEGYGVNYYSAPGGQFKGRVEGGATYKVYAEKDGYYDLGQSRWVKGSDVVIIK